MDIRHAVIAVVLPIALSGCNETVDTVKSSRMYFNDTFTIDEAFNNRKVCKSTSWEAVTDSRNRELVQYKCNLKGVASFEKEKRDKYRESLIAKFESEPLIAKEKLKYAQKEIDSLSANAEKQNGDHSQVLESMELIRLNALKKMLSTDSSHELLNLSSYGDMLSDKNLVKLAYSYEEQDRWMQLNSQYSEVTPERLATLEETKQKLQQAISLAMGETNKAIEAEENRLSSIQQTQSKDSKDYAENLLAEAHDTYANIKQAEDLRLQSAEQKLSEDLDKLENTPTVESANEIFERVVKGNEIEITWAGLEKVYSDGGTKKFSYFIYDSLPEVHMQKIFQNKIETYSQMPNY